MKKTLEPFYTIAWDFNSDNIEYYDVMPYLISCWKDQKKLKHKTWNSSEVIKGKTIDDTKMPETFEEFKKFILSNAQYQFWSRCEYECVVTGWPVQKNDVKIDVYQQIKANINVVTRIFMLNVC